MKVTYIGHSGFAVVFDSVTLIFDFFTDDSHVIPSLLASSQRIVVFSSHFHHDHFQKSIFDWVESGKEITYILSYDIPKHVRRLHTPDDTHIVHRGEVLQLSHDVTIHAFGSTDSGCSFLVNVEGKSIFHAGDLNNWNWKDESTDAEMRKMEGDYLKVLKDIKEVTTDMDLAMFPVDARMGREYYIGAQQFVSRFRVRNFIPMHFWDFKQQACAFDLYKNTEYGSYICLTMPGDSIEIQ